MKNYLIIDKKHKNNDDVDKLLGRVEAHFASPIVVDLDDINKDRCFDEFPNRLESGGLNNARIIIETGFQLVDLDKNIKDLKERVLKQSNDFTSKCITLLRHGIFVSLFKYPFVSTDNIVKEYLFIQNNIEITSDKELLDNLSIINYEEIEKALLYRMRLFNDFLEASRNEKRTSLSSSTLQIGFKKYASGETSTSVQVKPLILKMSADFYGDKSDKELYDGENRLLGRKAFYKYKKELKDSIIEQIKELHQDFNGSFDNIDTLKNIRFDNLDVPRGKIISEDNLKRLILEIKNS